MLQDGNIGIDEIKEIRMIGQPNTNNKNQKSYVIIECNDAISTSNLRKEIMKWIPTQSIKNVSRVEFYNPSRLRTQDNPYFNYHQNNRKNETKQYLRVRNNRIHNQRLNWNNQRNNNYNYNYNYQQRRNWIQSSNGFTSIYRPRPNWNGQTQNQNQNYYYRNQRGIHLIPTEIDFRIRIKIDIAKEIIILILILILIQIKGDLILILIDLNINFKLKLKIKIEIEM